MLSRLIRQRRRIAVFTICVLLALALHGAIPLAPVAAAAGAVVFAVLVILAVPGQRGWLEAAGVGLVVAAPLPLATNLLGPAALVAIVLVHALFYGKLSDGLGLRLGLDRKRKSRIDRSATEVWGALIPGECHPDDHWSGTLVDFDRDPDDAETVYLRYRTPAGVHEEATLTFVERTPHSHCRYFIERDDGQDHEEAVLTLGFTDLGPAACHVESRLQHEALPLRTALMRWFDDSFGDELHSFAATLHNRPDRTARETDAMPEPRVQTSALAARRVAS